MALSKSFSVLVLSFPFRKVRRFGQVVPGTPLISDVIKSYSPTLLFLALKACPKDSESLGVQAPIPWQQAMSRPMALPEPSKGLW